MLSLRIATRFLKTSPVQSGLIVAGIAVGIAVQIFVGSLITSLQENLVQTTVGNSPQVTVKAVDQGDPVAYTERLAATVENDPQVTALAKVRDYSALYSEGSEDAPLNVKAGEIAELDSIYRISSRLVAGEARLQSDDLLVGTEFAEKFAISPGEEIAVRLANGRDVYLTVVGVFDLGNATLNERQAFSAPGLGRSATGYNDEEYGAIETQVDEVFASTDVAKRWRQEVPEVKVLDWQQQNEDLLTALQSQGSSSYMIQAFVLLAVALGIASTLAISAVQKTRQIGILKAMGMSDSAAGLVFLWEATILGIVGTAAGIATGYLLIWGFSFAPVSFGIEVKLGFVAFSASVGITVALVSSIIPIRKTSRLDPIEVIQGG